MSQKLINFKRYEAKERKEEEDEEEMANVGIFFTASNMPMLPYIYTFAEI